MATNFFQNMKALFSRNKAKETTNQTQPVKFEVKYRSQEAKPITIVKSSTPKRRHKRVPRAQPKKQRREPRVYVRNSTLPTARSLRNLLKSNGPKTAAEVATVFEALPKCWVKLALRLAKRAGLVQTTPDSPNYLYTAS